MAAGPREGKRHRVVLLGRFRGIRSRVRAAFKCKTVQSWHTSENMLPLAELAGTSSIRRCVEGHVLSTEVTAKFGVPRHGLGPSLWNIHFADARLAVTAVGFVDVIFPCDLNCCKEFPASTPHAAIKARLEDCQSELHRWGAANRVCFDAGKESFHCLHRTRQFGEDFKMLGVTFDCQLTIKTAVQEIAREQYC